MEHISEYIQIIGNLSTASVPKYYTVRYFLLGDKPANNVHGYSIDLGSYQTKDEAEAAVLKLAERTGHNKFFIVESGKWVPVTNDPESLKVVHGKLDQNGVQLFKDDYEKKVEKQLEEDKKKQQIYDELAKVELAKKKAQEDQAREDKAREDKSREDRIKEDQAREDKELEDRACEDQLQRDKNFEILLVGKVKQDITEPANPDEEESKKLRLDLAEVFTNEPSSFLTDKPYLYYICLYIKYVTEDLKSGSIFNSTDQAVNPMYEIIQEELTSLSIKITEIVSKHKRYILNPNFISDFNFVYKSVMDPNIDLIEMQLIDEKLHQYQAPFLSNQRRTSTDPYKEYLQICLEAAKLDTEIQFSADSDLILKQLELNSRKIKQDFLNYKHAQSPEFLSEFRTLLLKSGFTNLHYLNRNLRYLEYILTRINLYLTQVHLEEYKDKFFTPENKNLAKELDTIRGINTKDFDDKIKKYRDAIHEFESEYTIGFRIKHQSIFLLDLEEILKLKQDIIDEVKDKIRIKSDESTIVYRVPKSEISDGPISSLLEQDNKNESKSDQSFADDILDAVSTTAIDRSSLYQKYLCSWIEYAELGIKFFEQKGSPNLEERIKSKKIYAFIDEYRDQFSFVKFSKDLIKELEKQNKRSTLYDYIIGQYNLPDHLK